MNKASPDAARAGEAASRTGAVSAAFDLKATLVRLDGDRDLLGMLIDLFEQDSVRLFAQLAEFAEARDAVAVAQAAHSLKGLVANFEARAATRAAQAVETLATASDFEGLASAVPRLEAELHTLRRALQQRPR